MSPYQRLDWKDRRLECPSFPYTGGYIRQYNQHEVDKERAANTLFQWDFDKFTTFLRIYQSVI